jgi:hypothetical protein
MSNVFPSNSTTPSSDPVCPECGSDDLDGEREAYDRIRLTCLACAATSFRAPDHPCPKCGSTNVDRTTTFGMRANAYDTKWFNTIEHTTTCRECQHVTYDHEPDNDDVVDYRSWTAPNLKARPVDELIAVAEYWGVPSAGRLHGALVADLLAFVASPWDRVKLGRLPVERLRAIAGVETDVDPSGMGRDELCVLLVTDPDLEYESWTTRSLKAQPAAELLEAARRWGLPTAGRSHSQLVSAMLTFANSDWTRGMLDKVPTPMLRDIAVAVCETDMASAARAELIDCLLEA